MAAGSIREEQTLQEDAPGPTGFPSICKQRELPLEKQKADNMENTEGMVFFSMSYIEILDSYNIIFRLWDMNPIFKNQHITHIIQLPCDDW